VPTGLPARPVHQLEESAELREAARLRAAILRLGRRLRSIEVPGGLTPAEFSALAVVVTRGPLRPSELARLEHLNPTMLSRMLARLIQAGVVRREEDCRDRRAFLVATTPKGRRLHQRLRAERARRLDSALGQLAAAERTTVVQALDALERLAELLREEGG
jgi:DNA-binding MarR family transcriptional regulator